ncbi:MAG: glycosyltransferase, partial [Thermomicrobiales bacterium]
SVHHCECERDQQHGRRFGFAGLESAVIPIAGGWDLDAASAFRTPGPVSARRSIALKAYDGWAGRAGTALEAIRRVGPALAGYTIELYRCNDEMWMRAEALSGEIGVPFVRASSIYGELAYVDILAMHGRSRISIGLSISDAISTSLLEAMLMGSFPIQSDTGCGDEWIVSGTNGILIPPEDPAPVADAIRRALDDDELVDQASRINAGIARQRLDGERLRQQAIEVYQLALRQRDGNARP